MWKHLVALKRAGWFLHQRVLARSDVPLLWRRLVVVAPTCQWLRRWLSAECSTKSQWGAAWGQMCHALQSSKLTLAWDPIYGSWPGSSLGYFKHENIKICWWLTKLEAIKMQFICIFCHICKKFECLISQSSVATCLRWGVYCHMAFIANFIRFPAVQKFWHTIKIWQS